jgi:hypothetical protein
MIHPDDVQTIAKLHAFVGALIELLGEKGLIDGREFEVRTLRIQQKIEQDMAAGRDATPHQE